MIASSATAGQPARPSRPESSPSFICAPSVSRGSWACWAIDAVERLDVLQRAAHQHRVATHLPSSEKTRTRAAESAIAPSSASCSPCESDGDGTDRVDVAVAGLAAEPPDLLDDAGGVGDRVGVGHRVHGGEAADRRGPGAGVTVSASSRPGSRRCVCRSTRPGSAMSPSRR